LISLSLTLQLGLGLTCLGSLFGEELQASVSIDDPDQTVQDQSWQTESLSSAANAVLNDLAESLVAGDVPERLFAAEFSCNLLRPQLEVLRDEGGIQVKRGSSAKFSSELTNSDAAEAVGTLLAPLKDGTERRASFKVVGIEPGDAETFSVEVLVQTSARLGLGCIQQNAKWTIGFTRVDAEAEWQLSAIQARSLDEVLFERVLFEDATSRALAAAGGSSTLLTEGAERWHGKIDNLGEANYFGHNGIAVGDVNGDDLDDLYVAQGTGLPNLLLVQQADGSFKEQGEASGAAWLDDTKGVLLADYDNDGDRDLIACIGPVLVLSTNDGTGVFTPSRSLGSGSTSAFYSLSAADYDLDGDLDIFAVRYVDTSYGDSIPMPFHDARNGPKNHLMRNDGEQGFVDVSAEVGLDVNNDRFSLACSWSDYDLDGDPDLYVANDFGRNNLYRNDGGKFVDVAEATGTEDQAAGMGVSWADVDQDGRFDLLVSNMFSSAGRRIAYQPSFKSGQDETERRAIQRHSLGNSLFCNQPDGSFQDASELAGLRMGRWSWGARFTDFDGDGLPDVVVPNGFLTAELEDDL
jgi:hypothetical protein